MKYFVSQTMRTISQSVGRTIASISFVSLTAFTLSYATTGVQYLYPVPGSKNTSPQSNIIVRFGPTLNKSITADTHLFSVRGSESGLIDGTIVLSDDQKTLLFQPTKNFLPGEKVFVSMNNKISALSGAELRSVEFDFTVSPLSALDKEALDRKALEYYLPTGQSDGGVRTHAGSLQLEKVADNALPATLPMPSLRTFSQPTRESIFLSPWKVHLTSTGLTSIPSENQYLIIMDYTGLPIFFRQMPGTAIDFKELPNGSLIYFDAPSAQYFVLNKEYAVTDSIQCGNGYKTDPHDFRLLPNGHIVFLGLDPRTVDMSTVVSGGNKNATVIGNIIQELDLAKRVVFEWRSLDHFQVTDATHEDLTASTIDFDHANALEIDADSNILLSNRHMDEITKIDRSTGKIIWRWGGKNNQFAFINDTIGFSHQHSINRTTEGNFILFDNGNFHTPQYSRALEYTLDDQAKTATLVWQYRHTPDVFTVAMGSVERLPNGNTFIGWGASTLAATEVRPDGTTEYEIQFPDSIISYRAYKNIWNNVTSVAATNEVPKLYSLNQNYPNPFNPSTNIRFSIPETQFITLKIFDVLGRQIATLADGIMLPGNHTVNWDAARMASGVYFYTLKAGNFIDTKKMLVLR